MTKCSICMENINNKKNLYRSICNHKFHKNCIIKWLEIKPNCPYCRKYFKFKKSNYSSYYNRNRNFN